MDVFRIEGVVAVALAVCIAGVMHADDADLQTRMRDIEAEINAMQKGKGAPATYKAYLEVMADWQELQERQGQEQKGLQERMRDLGRDPDVQAWSAKITEKRQARNRLRHATLDDAYKRGQALHARRKKELAAASIAAVPNAQQLGFDLLTYPHVDGSTSAQPLGLVIACKVLGSPYRWAGTARYNGRWQVDDDTVDSSIFVPFAHSIPAGWRSASDTMAFQYGERFVLVGYRAVAVAGDDGALQQNRKSTVINRMLTVHAGTHAAYKNIISGDADLGLVARRPSEDERALAATNGVTLDVRPVALDAFVFIKNYKNEVSDLTTAQIRDIYTATVTNWKSVGGKDAPIRAYLRNRNSGSQELMKSLVMKDLELYEPERAHTARLVRNGMGGPYIALSQDERGIAYSVYFYEHFMAGSPNTDVLSVDGVRPTFETIQARTYPYVTEVYAVVRSDLPPDAPGIRLRDWLLTSEGQAVIRESGYVPLQK